MFNMFVSSSKRYNETKPATPGYSERDLVIARLHATREYRVTERSNSRQVDRQTEYRSVYFVIYKSIGRATW